MEEACGLRPGVPKEREMLTFILLAVFAIIGITFFLVAYSANQRRRSGQSGLDAVHHQQVTRPRGSSPGL
jgi:hypothetical protein